MTTIQDTHSGGVLSVSMPPGSRYGIVPRALLEDPRLSLDTRAVAAWLSTQDAGFQIVIAVLCRKMGLGKERWLRIARELEGSGYLSRRKHPIGVDPASGRQNQWKWEITFTPVPNGSPGVDFSVVGSPDHGAPVHGQPDHIRIQLEEHNLKNIYPPTSHRSVGPPRGATHPPTADHPYHSDPRIPATPPSPSPAGATRPPRPRHADAPRAILDPQVEGLDLEAWRQFVEYRRGIGRALKPPSVKAAQGRLVRLSLDGSSQAAIVEQSIENGWTALFALKNAGGRHATCNRMDNSAPARVARACAERERRAAERARDGAAVDPHDADLRPPLDVQFRRNG